MYSFPSGRVLCSFEWGCAVGVQTQRALARKRCLAFARIQNNPTRPSIGHHCIHTGKHCGVVTQSGRMAKKKISAEMHCCFDSENISRLQHICL